MSETASPQPAAPSSHFAKIAALVEILFVIALGNIAGIAIFDAVVPAAVAAGEASGVEVGLYAGLRIFLRIGLIAAFGLALLKFRRGTTLRDAGLTRAGKPLGELVGIGIVLGGFTSFLVGVIFAVHSIIPLGEGLSGWTEITKSTLDTAFYVDLLATAIIIPPLTEEIMARGYSRLRMVESYGPMGGVIMTGLIFALAHTKFISTDPLLALSLVALIVGSTAWTYIVHKTGSLIPAMVAHAMTNSIATMILFGVWLPFAAVTALVAWQHRPILNTMRQFAADWRADRQKSGLLFGIVALVAIAAAIMLAMSQFDRTMVLAAIGIIGLLITVANIVREKRGA